MSDYKRVDIDEDACYKGWSYLNQDGNEETVSLPSGFSEKNVDINIDDHEVCVYVRDIPKLIKALQAAYDYKE